MRNNSNSRWLVALALGAILNAQQGGRGGAPPANVPAPTSPVTGNAVSGKGLFFGYGCYACHGYNGETGARPFVGRWGNLATEQSFPLIFQSNELALEISETHTRQGLRDRLGHVVAKIDHQHSPGRKCRR